MNKKILIEELSEMIYSHYFTNYMDLNINFTAEILKRKYDKIDIKENKIIFPLIRDNEFILYRKDIISNKELLYYKPSRSKLCKHIETVDIKIMLEYVIEFNKCPICDINNEKKVNYNKIIENTKNTIDNSNKTSHNRNITIDENNINLTIDDIYIDNTIASILSKLLETSYNYIIFNKYDIDEYRFFDENVPNFQIPVKDDKILINYTELTKFILYTELNLSDIE